MQGQDQKQAYDRGTTTFSPDGRLYQVEYAGEAVKQGSPSIGIRTDEGVVLLTDEETSSTLLEQSSIEKLHKVDEHIGIASAGQAADGRRLIDFAREQAQRNRAQYEEPIDVEGLTKRLSDQIHEYTQVGQGRPYGVSLIVGGVDNGRPRLFETDPGGTPREWAALAIGRNRRDIQSFLEEEYTKHLSLEEGIGLAIRALATGTDESVSPDAIGIATVDTAGERYHELSDDEIREQFDGLELGDDDSRDDTE